MSVTIHFFKSDCATWAHVENGRVVRLYSLNRRVEASAEVARAELGDVELGPWRKDDADARRTGAWVCDVGRLR